MHIYQDARNPKVFSFTPKITHGNIAFLEAALEFAKAQLPVIEEKGAFEKAIEQALEETGFPKGESTPQPLKMDRDPVSREESEQMSDRGFEPVTIPSNDEIVEAFEAALKPPPKKTRKPRAKKK